MKSLVKRKEFNAMKVYILMKVNCMTDYSEVYAVYLNEQEAQVQAKSLNTKYSLYDYVVEEYEVI